MALDRGLSELAVRGSVLQSPPTALPSSSGITYCAMKLCIHCALTLMIVRLVSRTLIAKRLGRWRSYLHYRIGQSSILLKPFFLCSPELARQVSPIRLGIHCLRATLACKFKSHRKVYLFLGIHPTLLFFYGHSSVRSRDSI